MSYNPTRRGRKLTATEMKRRSWEQPLRPLDIPAEAATRGAAIHDALRAAMKAASGAEVTNIILTPGEAGGVVVDVRSDTARDSGHQSMRRARVAHQLREALDAAGAATVIRAGAIEKINVAPPPSGEPAHLTFDSIGAIVPRSGLQAAILTACALAAMDFLPPSDEPSRGPDRFDIHWDIRHIGPDGEEKSVSGSSFADREEAIRYTYWRDAILTLIQGTRLIDLRHLDRLTDIAKETAAALAASAEPLDRMIAAAMDPQRWQEPLALSPAGEAKAAAIDDALREVAKTLKGAGYDGRYGKIAMSAANTREPYVDLPLSSCRTDDPTTLAELRRGQEMVNATARAQAMPAGLLSKDKRGIGQIDWQPPPGKDPIAITLFGLTVRVPRRRLSIALRNAAALIETGLFPAPPAEPMSQDGAHATWDAAGSSNGGIYHRIVDLASPSVLDAARATLWRSLVAMHLSGEGPVTFSVCYRRESMLEAERARLRASNHPVDRIIAAALRE